MAHKQVMDLVNGVLPKALREGGNTTARANAAYIVASHYNESLGDTTLTDDQRQKARDNTLRVAAEMLSTLAGIEGSDLAANMKRRARKPVDRALTQLAGMLQISPQELQAQTARFRNDS